MCRNNVLLCAAAVLAIAGALHLLAVRARAQSDGAAAQKEKALPARTHPVPGFHHLAMRSSDFDRSLRFYTEGLGLKRAYGWGEGDGRAALLDAGDGSYLEIFAGGKRKPGEDPPEGAVMHFALRVQDPPAAFRRAVEAGARPVTDPQDVTVQGDRPLVFRIAFVKGPDGEVIEFFRCDDL